MLASTAPSAPHSAFNPQHLSAPLRIIPIGGCGEFGMNMTAYLASGKLYIVDCGVRFPEPQRLGVDAILPDIEPWFKAAGGVHAYLLTHGHEDHLGAMAHILQRWPAPVYGTAWTIELLKAKFQRLGLDADAFQLVTVEAGDHVATSTFDAEYVHMNHSIPMACALLIKVPGLSVFHTGDFKFDRAPVIEAPADFARLKAIGDEGVDYLLADSTNAEKSGHCPGEASVLEPMIKAMDYSHGAVIVTTFASNLWRLKTIADACVASGKRLLICGNGLLNALTIAKKLGVYELPTSLKISDEQVSTFPRERLVIMATGCQGEWRAAMARMAAGEHRTVRIKAGDRVVFSSRIIPGNEKSVHQLTNSFLRLGADIVTPKDLPGIHVSGHAFGGDLEELVGLLRPRHILPVHGGFSQLQANGTRSGEAAAPSGSSQLIENGDVLDLRPDAVTIASRIQIGMQFVDSESSTILNQETLRDRLRIGELGAALVSGVFDTKKDSWLVKPDIELTGLSLPLSVSLIDWQRKTSKAVISVVKHMLQKGQDDVQYITEEVRILVRRQLFQQLNKKPVVTVKLHFV